MIVEADLLGVGFLGGIDMLVSVPEPLMLESCIEGAKRGRQIAFDENGFAKPRIEIVIQNPCRISCTLGGRKNRQCEARKLCKQSGRSDQLARKSSDVSYDYRTRTSPARNRAKRCHAVLVPTWTLARPRKPEISLFWSSANATRT